MIINYGALKIIASSRYVHNMRALEASKGLNAKP